MGLAPKLLADFVHVGMRCFGGKGLNLLIIVFMLLRNAISVLFK